MSSSAVEDEKVMSPVDMHADSVGRLLVDVDADADIAADVEAEDDVGYKWSGIRMLPACVERGFP